ncbi:MAG: hypothetical protein P4K83_00530 [Terracidiphilus sp.]|nr:hypothetical protein [Terracidiphilus sp.]
MDCPEMLLEGLAKEARTIENHVMRLNVKAEQICSDEGLRQEFAHIKTELKNLAGAMEAALEKGAAAVGRR